MKSDNAPIHWPGEPNRICGNCQHFRQIKASKNGHGFCHNLISGRMTTGLKTGFNETCVRGFYPDVLRFPLHVRLNVPAEA